MEALLSKLQEVLQEARALVTEYTQKLKAVETRENDVDEKIINHHQILEEINLKKSQIEPIENLHAARKAHEDNVGNLASERSKFEDEKQKFKTDSDATRQNLNNRAVELDQMQKNIDHQQKTINDTIQKKYDDFVSKFKTKP